MLPHEGGHVLTLRPGNDPEIVGRDHQLASDMAEALALAIQISIVDRCAVSYEDLFPDGCMQNRNGYLDSHPWITQNAGLIRRLVEELEDRGEQSLVEIYRQVFEEFASARS